MKKYILMTIILSGCGSTNSINFQADEYAKARACQAAMETSACDSTKSCLVQVRHKGGMLTCRR